MILKSFHSVECETDAGNNNDIVYLRYSLEMKFQDQKCYHGCGNDFISIHIPEQAPTSYCDRISTKNDNPKGRCSI